MTLSKQGLRLLYLEKRKAMSSEEISFKSDRICERLKAFFSDAQLKSEVIAAYSAFKNEVDLMPILKWFTEEKKKLFLPFQVRDKRSNRLSPQGQTQKFSSTFRSRTSDHGPIYHFVQCVDAGNELKKGRFGILESTEDPHLTIEEAKTVIDLWLIPGVVFDKRGYRIGLGKGCYDRFLSNAKGLKIGVAYEWQVMEKIPSDLWDVPMDYIVTEKGLLRRSIGSKSEARWGKSS